jgi:hypothetical protein
MITFTDTYFYTLYFVCVQPVRLCVMGGPRVGNMTHLLDHVGRLLFLRFNRILCT